jgi:hypothetical protein
MDAPNKESVPHLTPPAPTPFIYGEKPYTMAIFSYSNYLIFK